MSVLEGMPGVEDHIGRACGRLTDLAFFSEQDYLELNPDIGMPGAIEHALRWGAPEGRRIFSEVALVRALAEVDKESYGVPASLGLSDVATNLGLVQVIHSSTAGSRSLRMVHDLVSTFEASGIVAQVSDERARVPDVGGIPIVVGPHEFYYRGLGPLWVRDCFVGRSLVCSTASVGTSDFSRALPFLLFSAGVIDGCPQLVALLRSAGMPAMHLDPAVGAVPPRLTSLGSRHDLVRALPVGARRPISGPVQWGARPLDVQFSGRWSPRRQQHLAQMAPDLAPLDSFVHLWRDSGPGTSQWDAGLFREIHDHVAYQSRVTLNLPSQDVPIFDWGRVVDRGCAAGAVVVSEPTLGNPTLHPGVHYLQANPRELGQMIRWLLQSPDGREEGARVLESCRSWLDTARDKEHSDLVRFVEAAVPDEHR